MSERSKGDVSRVNNNANRIVKNPLLTASVTGLTFDDFPNKPVLLPAAPPVVHAPPPQPTSALIAGILNRGKCVSHKRAQIEPERATEKETETEKESSEWAAVQLSIVTCCLFFLLV